MKNYLKFIKLNEESITPKYLKIYNAFLAAIESKQLEVKDVLPSINDLTPIKMGKLKMLNFHVPKNLLT